MRSSIRAVLCTSVALCAATAHSEEWTAERKAELAAIATRLGVTAITALASEYPPVPAAIVGDGPRGEALNDLLQSYISARAKAHDRIDFARSAVSVTLDAVALGTAVTGAGAVPAAIFKAAGQAASDAYYDDLQRRVDETMMQYLKAKEPEIIEATGNSLSDLQGLSDDALKATIENQTSLFSEMRTAVGDDPIAQERIQSMIVTAMHNVDLEIVNRIHLRDEQIAGAISSVIDLDRRIDVFQNATEEALRKHEEAIGTLIDDVESLSSAIDDVDKRLSRAEVGGTIMADFVFSSMSPGLKAQALENGFMADRFSCVPEQTECDGPALKAAMIERFRAEADVAKTIGALQETVSGVAGAVTIARALGADVGGLEDVVHYGAVAVNAFAAISTGNYIGAVAQLSGAFGSSVDPDAERFDVLMGYLSTQFEQINKKIDVIVENQKILMDSLENLAQQNRDQYRLLQAHLANMDFEMRRIGDILGATAWKDWQPCYTVSDYVIKNEEIFRYREKGDITSLDLIYQVVDAQGSAVISCIAQGQNAPISLTAKNWFGSFLDARYLLEFSAEVEIPPSVSSLYNGGTELERFIDVIHTPTIRRLLLWASNHSMPYAALTKSLRESSLTIYEDEVHTTSGIPCGPSGYLDDRTKRLLCGQPLQAADDAASDLLRTPMVADAALETADWLLLTARIADVYDQASGSLIRRNELLERLQEISAAANTGRDIVEKVQIMLDVAITGYAAVYGSLPAAAYVEAIEGAEPTDDETRASWSEELQALRLNPYLVANVAITLLRERYGARLQQNRGVSSTAYRVALEYAVDHEDDPGYLLRGIFGDDLHFRKNMETKQIEIGIDGSDDLSEEIWAPVPGVDQFVEGTLIYPPKMLQLLAMRDRVAERLADYNAFAEVDTAGAELAVLSILRSAQIDGSQP